MSAASSSGSPRRRSSGLRRASTRPTGCCGGSSDGLGGVVLFARNVARPRAAPRARRRAARRAATTCSSRSTRRAATSRGSRPRPGSSYPGNCALGAVDDVELTGASPPRWARISRASGVEPRPRAGRGREHRTRTTRSIGVRSFGADPELVARHVAAFVADSRRRAWPRARSTSPATATRARTRISQLPTVDGDSRRPALLSRSAPRSRRASRAIMTAHIRVPALDEGRRR